MGWDGDGPEVGSQPRSAPVMPKGVERKASCEPDEDPIQRQADLRALQDRPPPGQGLRDLRESPPQAAARLNSFPDKAKRNQTHGDWTDASYPRCRHPERQAHG